MIRLLVIGWWRIWGWHFCYTLLIRGSERSRVTTWAKGDWEEVRNSHWDTVGWLTDQGWEMDTREFYVPGEPI